MWKTEDMAGLQWGRFIARAAAGVAIIAIGTTGGLFMERETGRLQWLGAGVALAGLALFALLLTGWERRDEFDRALDRVTSAHAGIAAMLLVFVQNMIVALDLSDATPIPVFGLPGFFLLYKTMMAQRLRRAIAKGKDIRDLAVLRP